MPGVHPTGTPLILHGAYGPYLHAAGHLRADRVPLVLRDGSAVGTYALYLVLDGRVDLGGAARGALRHGAAALVPPSTPMRLVLARGGRVLFLRFDAVFQPRRPAGEHGRAQEHAAAGIAQPAPETVWGIPLPIAVPAALLPGCRAMMAACVGHWCDDAWSYARACHRLGGFLLDLVDAQRPRGPVPAGWLARAQALADEQRHRGLGVAALAAIAGISRQCLSGRWRREHGGSPGAWLRGRRLETACRLLRSTDAPMREVARISGFRSPSSLSHCFRRRMGLSPTRYRREQRV